MDNKQSGGEEEKVNSDLMNILKDPEYSERVEYFKEKMNRTLGEKADFGGAKGNYSQVGVTVNF